MALYPPPKIKFRNATTTILLRAKVVKQLAKFRSDNKEADKNWYYQITFIDKTNAKIDIYCGNDVKQRLEFVKTINSDGLPKPKVGAIVQPKFPTNVLTNKKQQ